MNMNTTFLTQLGAQTAPKLITIESLATTSLLDNRLEGALGYVKTFADVIIT